MSTFPEPAVSRALGLKKKRVVGARHAAQLEKGADWTLVDSVVHYSRRGLTRLCQALGLPPAALAEEKFAGGATPAGSAGRAGEAIAGQGEALAGQTIAGDNAGGYSAGHGPAEAGEPPPALAAAIEQARKKLAPVWIEVTARPANVVIVHGRLEGRPVTVRVKDNSNFVPGLWIQATPLNGANYFSMVGRLPRWRGDRHGFGKPSATATNQEDQDDDIDADDSIPANDGQQ